MYSQVSITTISAQLVRERALALGFDRLGMIPAQPAATLNQYLSWIAAGMHGEMGYMAREDRAARRRDLNVILPGAQSLLMVAIDYGDLLPLEILEDPSRGRIAAYAWGADYHDIIGERLETLAAWLREEGCAARAYVDTGAILERAHAQAAGMGFIGKNTMLIHPRRGSKFFLGSIITTAEMSEYDAPHLPPTMCGSCTRCLTACPTNAFPAPHVLDARRCISYLTIEHKGNIPLELRPQMGNWVFGCDVCQDVCPWQRFAEPTREAAFKPLSPDRAAPRLTDLLALNDNMFAARFDSTPLARIKRERLVRNACVAAGNWGGDEAAPSLKRLLKDDSALVRDHAAWALTRIA